MELVAELSHFFRKVLLLLSLMKLFTREFLKRISRLSNENKQGKLQASLKSLLNPPTQTRSVHSDVVDTLVPEVFFRGEETRQERERSGERKPPVAGDANLTIILR